MTLNNYEIIHHHDFPANLDVRNIEFGAGINCFGKIEFPLCYLTDMHYHGLPHFTEIPDYENNICHFLDGICDFTTFNPGRRFERLIFCNPYGFGFRGREESKIFLNRASELLTDNGEIFLLGNSSNPWVKHRNVRRYLEILRQNNELNHPMEVLELVTIDSEHRINTNYLFNCSDLNFRTIPNQVFTIRKTA